jgi:hypothetical protein
MEECTMKNQVKFAAIGLVFLILLLPMVNAANIAISKNGAFYSTVDVGYAIKGESAGTSNALGDTAVYGKNTYNPDKYPESVTSPGNGGGYNGVAGTSIEGYGVYARSIDSDGIHADSTNGSGGSFASDEGYGVYATTLKGDSAVYGKNPASGNGVAGTSDGGRGVYGRSTQGSGVFGESTNGYGIQSLSAGNYAIFASGNIGGIYATATQGPAVTGSSTVAGYTGVKGMSVKGYGVYGESDGDSAIYGKNTASGNGVAGTSVSGIGIYGRSDSGYGVYCDSASCGGKVSWTSSSDARLKKNITTIENALEKVEKMRGVNFVWKNSSYTGNNLGFVAQELVKVVPEVVGKDANGYYTVKSSDLTALLVEAIKEQQTQIEQLKTIVCADHPSAQACN